MSFYNGLLNHNEYGQGQRGLPGIGFKLDSNNDYDMQNKKLVNVKQGTDPNDVDRSGSIAKLLKLVQQHNLLKNQVIL